MPTIKYMNQIDMRAPARDPHHLVRLQDMVEYVAGMHKGPVRLVSTEVLVGTYDSTSKTFTMTSSGPLTIDGVQVAIGDRILLTAQTTLTQNGIYTVTDAGASGAAILTRASDFDNDSELVQGVLVAVQAGDEYTGSQWKLELPNGIPVLDTTDITFNRQTVITRHIAEKSFQIVGDDNTAVYNFTHDFGTKNVSHEMFDTVTGDTVVTVFRRTSNNAVQVEFCEAIATGEEYTLIVRGEVSSL